MSSRIRRLDAVTGISRRRTWRAHRCDASRSPHHRDSDGGLTLYIQNESPGKDKEANWLPAPKGPFWLAMRLYWPKDDAISGKWAAPPVKRVR